MANAKAAEDFVNSMMDEIPFGDNRTVTVTTPSKTRKKRSDADDQPLDNPPAGDDKVPVICSPITPEDSILPQMLKDAEPARLIYDQVILQMAEEAVHLKKLREALAMIGIPFSKVSRDLTSVLKDLSDVMERKAKEQALSGNNSGKIDFTSENFQRIFVWFLAQVKGACEDSSIQKHNIDMIFAKLQQRMNGFEAIAEELYNGDEVSKKKKTKANSEVKV